jgi:hypothetical protein
MNEMLERLDKEVTESCGEAIPENLINLMERLVWFEISHSFSLDELESLQEMISNLGGQLIACLKRSAEQVLQNNTRDKIPSLIRVRDLIKANLLPSWVKKELQPQLSAIYRELKKGSVDKAISLLLYVNELLESAEANARNEELPAQRRLSSVGESVFRVTEWLDRMPRHVRYVGLPVIAKEKGMTVEAMVEAIQVRVQTLRGLIPELEERAEYEREHAEEIAAEKRAKWERERQEALRMEEESVREQTLEAMKRRCPKAAESARQFYHNLEMGNLDGAWSCLNQVQRLDGGIPKIIQDDYGKAARQWQECLDVGAVA